MKNNQIIYIALFLSALSVLASSGGQKAEWKGKIAIENGVNQSHLFPYFSSLTNIRCIKMIQIV